MILVNFGYLMKGKMLILWENREVMSVFSIKISHFKENLRKF